MIADNDLLLYHYGDGLDANERRRIEAALRAEPELAARLRKLVAQLDAAAMSEDVPVPPDVQRRWQSALDRAALDKTANGTRSPQVGRLLARAASVGAATILGVFVWTFWSESPDRNDPPAPTVNNPASASAEHGLRWHLASAEQQLAALDSASDEQRAALIDTVIAQNRLYTAAAEKAGDQRLARALRSFTPILEDLAASQSEGDLAQLNFELRVMQARLAAESSRSTPTPPLSL